MLKADNISYSYDDGTEALKNVNLTVNKGEIVSLLGKNGAGKSTLFLHFNGILKPEKGKIFIDGEELKYDKKNLINFRQKKAPHHLSGEKKKRVAIAGILAMKPEIMVLDEPTSGLDPKGASDILKLLYELNEEGMTIIISTHDVDSHDCSHRLRRNQPAASPGLRIC